MHNWKWCSVLMLLLKMLQYPCFSLESSSKFQYYIEIAPSVILLEILWIMNNLWKDISFLLRKLTELLLNKYTILFRNRFYKSKSKINYQDISNICSFFFFYFISFSILSKPRWYFYLKAKKCHKGTK